MKTETTAQSGQFQSQTNYAPIRFTGNHTQRHQERPHSMLELRAMRICCPTPRALALLKRGHHITPTWCEETSSTGVKHRIGIYSLASQKGAEK
ncbi:MAG: helix-turn-helix domain-containing protein [Neisseria sp.]|uniref:helix-turn-helix domain-containing protein n=1 Tax=Neisseria sp. TaxID=192066 RepID=UPI0026DBADC5|nr:helix-turn-helix domain-containing protein [Neisseria sp.]MDO4642011.1 helix-turn-helix domain-containing protein [Neisseria sp.]